MIPTKSTLLLIAVLLVTTSEGAHAQTVKLLAAGPSSLSQPLAVAAVNGRAGPNSHHWTGRAQLIKKGSPQEPLNGVLWVVWSSDEKNVWAYFALDSAAGAHATVANATYKLHIDSAAMSLPGQNKIASGRFSSGDPCQGEPQSVKTCDAGSLPVSVGKSLLHARVSRVTSKRNDNMPHCTNQCDGQTKREVQYFQKALGNPSIMRETAPEK